MDGWRTHICTKLQCCHALAVDHGPSTYPSSTLRHCAYTILLHTNIMNFFTGLVLLNGASLCDCWVTIQWIFQHWTHQYIVIWVLHACNLWSHAWASRRHPVQQIAYVSETVLETVYWPTDTGVGVAAAPDAAATAQQPVSWTSATMETTLFIHQWHIAAAYQEGLCKLTKSRCYGSHGWEWCRHAHVWRGLIKGHHMVQCDFQLLQHTQLSADWHIVITPNANLHI